MTRIKGGTGIRTETEIERTEMKERKRGIRMLKM
jgi:hypothetical protein